MKLGLLYVLSVPYAAGFACFGGPTVGGYRLTGWIFAVMLAAAPLVFVLDRTPSRFPILIWVPWITVVLASLFWADVIGRWQLQDAFQIITPFVIAPIASKSIKNERHVALLLRGFNHCLIILVAATVLFFFASASVLVRPMALTAALLGCVYVGQVNTRLAFAMSGWSVCLLITVFTGSRIATIALLLEWVLLPRFRQPKYRIAIGALILAFAAALFYTPVFQQRFFGGAGGTFDDLVAGNFSSSGRFTAWPELWEDVKRRPVIGAGISSSGRFVKDVWEQANKPHNDYLRVLLEQGCVGLACLLFGVAFQLLSLRRTVGAVDDGRTEVRKATIVGYLVFLVVAFTDNPIVYGVWFMHPLLTLTGASYPPFVASPTNTGSSDATDAESSQ